MKPNIYIWQQPDWPHFTWDYDSLMPLLRDIRLLQGRLAGAMGILGFDVGDRAQLDAMTDDLVSSSTIEGVILNPESVRSSIARKLGLDIGGARAEDHYVDGLVDVMMDAVGNCTAPLTAERLFGWHAAIFPTGHSGHARITVAGWRTGDEAMQVVSGAMGKEKVHYEAPPSAVVPAEMERFLQWASGTVADDVIAAAVAHLWFVTIHPFDDGNGRISRTISDLFLSRSDGLRQRYYSMSFEILRCKREYYEILERTQKGGLDITPWLQWFMNCLLGALRRSQAVVERTLDKAAYWDNFRDVGVNERQRKIINRLWDGFDGKLTSSKYAKICHCSQDTAGRDIADLIAKGMLRDSGEGGRSKNYLLP